MFSTRWRKSSGIGSRCSQPARQTRSGVERPARPPTPRSRRWHRPALARSTTATGSARAASARSTPTASARLATTADDAGVAAGRRRCGRAGSAGSCRRRDRGRRAGSSRISRSSPIDMAGRSAPRLTHAKPPRGCFMLKEVPGRPRPADGKEPTADGRHLPRTDPQDRPGQAGRLPELLRRPPGPEVPEAAGGRVRPPARSAATRPRGRTAGRVAAAGLRRPSKASGSAAFRDIAQARAVVEAAFARRPGRVPRRTTPTCSPTSRTPTCSPPSSWPGAARPCWPSGPPGRPRPARRRRRRRPERLRRLPPDRRARNPAAAPTTTRTRRSARCRCTSKGVGVAPGRYADLVRPALDLLAKTDRGRSSTRPASTRTSSTNWRSTRGPHDHFHPVNKRPNVLFGEWDPHTIDNRGFYRRFVLRQTTLDTLLTWSTPSPARGGRRRARSSGTPGERLFEAAAVLAGTILMGAGMSGAGPNYYDSSVTLAKLVPKIARYRDGFYQRLLEVPARPARRAAPGGGREAEAAVRRRPPVPQPGHRRPAGVAPAGPPAGAAVRRDGLPGRGPASGPG